VRVAVFPGAITALVFVAEAEGFFARRGLDVALTLYEAGVTSLEHLAAGRLDIAAVMEYPFATARVRTEDLRIITSVAATDNLELIGRRDRGLARPGDWKGKRIGVTRGTFGEFFLAVFLAHQGLRVADIETVHLPPSAMEGAVAAGEVDGVIVWQPFVHAIRQRMGDRVVSWPAQGGQDAYALLVARDAYLRRRPAAVERLLHALVEAEDYARRHAAEAQAIVQRRFGYERAFLARLWAQNRLEVRLTQDLLTLMDDEARWAMGRDALPGQRMPNFLQHIYLDALEKVRPEAVTVIR